MALGKECGNLSQGNKKTGTKGTNSIFIMVYDEIRNIQWDRVITYARLVVDFRLQKEDLNWVQHM